MSFLQFWIVAALAVVNVSFSLYELSNGDRVFFFLFGSVGVLCFFTGVVYLVGQ